jgi:hypothetical protein
VVLVEAPEQVREEPAELPQRRAHGAHSTRTRQKWLFSFLLQYLNNPPLLISFPR